MAVDELLDEQKYRRTQIKSTALVPALVLKIVQLELFYMLEHDYHIF